MSKRGTPETDKAAQFISHFDWQVHADFARRLERQRDALADALRELVRLKDLHDRVERKDFATFHAWAGAHEAYTTDKPHAWINARALLAELEPEP